MNSVIIIGNLGKDVELNNGVARTSIGVRRDFKDKQTNEYGTDWINLVAFGKTAELMNSNLSKGRKIAVNGRINTGSYDNKEGKKVYTFDVVVNTFEFLDKKESGKQQSSQQSFVPTMEEDDLLPF